MNLDHIHDLIGRAESLASLAHCNPASPIEIELADTLRDLAYVVRALADNQVTLAANQVELAQHVQLLMERER